MTRAAWALAGLAAASLGAVHERLWPGTYGILLQALGVALFLWGLMK